MLKFETESCGDMLDNTGDYYYPYTCKQWTYPTYQQGWICPKCGRVFSPSVTECSYCNSQTYTITCTSDPTITIGDINYNGEENLGNN